MPDVLIVGASVAGSAAAIHLARMGYQVEMIDQAEFPRRKPCGEGLFSSGTRELHALGVLDAVAAESRLLETMRFRLGDAVVEAALPEASEPHLGVRRDLLDHRLAAAAVAAGIVLRTGVQVRKATESDGGFSLDTTEGRLTARVIVGADGVNSRLRRDAGLQRSVRRQRFGMSAHVRLAAEVPPRVDVIFQHGREVYLTPVTEQSANAAVLLREPATQALKGRLEAGYLSLLREAGIEAELLDEPLMGGPFPAQSSRLWRGNLVLTGDAAGTFDPITGEGMSLALQSARLCAESVARYLVSGEGSSFEAYERQQRAMTRNSTLLARLVLFLSSHPALGRRAILNLRRNPATMTRLIEINNGAAGFVSLRPRDLSALLFGV